MALSAKALKTLAGSLEITLFSFCEMLPIKQWDKMIVISPYINLKTVEKENLGNFKQAFKILKNNTLSEEKCTLLFLWKRNIIAYTKITRLPIDFSYLLDDSSAPIKNVYFYLKKHQYETQTKFIVYFKKGKN